MTGGPWAEHLDEKWLSALAKLSLQQDPKTQTMVRTWVRARRGRGISGTTRTWQALFQSFFFPRISAFQSAYTKLQDAQYTLRRQ